MIVLATGIFTGAVSTRLLDALLPEIAHGYGKDVAAAGLAVTAYSFSYSCCQLLFGPLGDRFGPLRLTMIGALLAGIAALGCALSSSLTGLIAARLVAGAVTAGITPMAMAWISHATGAEERAVSIANMSGASIVGSSVGQIGGGLIGDWLGWQACFVLVACLFLLSGFALIRVGMRYPDLVVIGRRDVGDAGGTAISLWALLHRPPVRRLLASVGIEGFALYMSLTYVSVLLHERLGLGLAEIGLMMGCFGLGGIGFVLLARPIVARLAEAWRARMGGLCVGAGFLMLSLFHAPAVAAIGLGLIGSGFFMIHNIFQVRATHIAPDATGSAISLFAASFFLFQSLGAAFGSWALGRIGVGALCALSAVAFLMLGWIIGRQSALATRSSV